MAASTIVRRMLPITFALVLHCYVAATVTDEVPSDAPACTVRLGLQATGEGTRNRTFNGVEFCEFLGIPYAKPPVGELRFSDPVFQEPEGQHNNYTVYGSQCAQFDDINNQTRIIGAEDCLFLNVYTPLINTTARDSADQPIRFPVLVYIHGGSHVAGSGIVHGVDLLMENEVIVVTLNYRLGVLGFLKHERHNITGNYGLKDQLMALRWISGYVEHFGGDPNRVTVMAHSAGASDLTNHLYHERARGLFQGAIVLSGSMLASWGILYDYEKCFDNYLRDLGSTTLTELRELSTQEFFLKDFRLRYTFAFASMFFPCFAPTLEDRPNDEGAYFHRPPHETVRTKTPHQMPILVSETYTELELMLSHVTNFWMNDNYINNRQPMLKLEIAEILENICHWVVAQGLESSPRKFYRKMANMANLQYPIRRLLHTLVEQMQNDEVYYLRFQFDGKFGENKKNIFAWYVDNTVYGAMHGDELGYIFSPYNLKKALENRTAYRHELSVHIKTVELIANFVKYGNPTPKRSKLSGLVWPAYNESRNQTQYLNIDEEFTLQHVDNRNNIYYMVWKLIYECLYYSRCEAVSQLVHLSESFGAKKAVRDDDFNYSFEEEINSYFS